VTALARLLAAALAPLNAWLLALLAAAVRGRARQPPPHDGVRRLRFAVLVPARDEAASIRRTLASLLALDERPGLMEIIVVADNCTDHTAAVAADAGATVWVREGDVDGGKGAALGWALARLAAERPEADAAVLVDADCVVAANLLRAIEGRLLAGADAVQTVYAVSNPGASWTAALRWASFALVNVVRPQGKAALGLSAGLFGTGMAFTRELLARRPWVARSLLEDQEHHLALVAGGERVAFAAETWVVSPMPTSLKASSSQQLRWDAGRARLARTWSPRLIGAGLRRRDTAQLYAAVEPLLPPQALLLAANGACCLLALRTDRATRAIALCNVAAQTLFVVGGLTAVRAPAPVWRALACAPALAAWKLHLLAKLWLRRGPTTWVRTDREGQVPRVPA